MNAKVQDFIKQSKKVKDDKKSFSARESHQLSKDISSYICRGTRIKIPISNDVSIVKFDTTCSNCGDRSGEAFIVDGKQLCGLCKKRSIKKGESKCLK